MSEKNRSHAKVSESVMSVIHEAALEEDRLRQKGARRERINATVGKKLAKNIIYLALQGEDTSLAFPPEKQSKSEMTQDDDLTDDQWAKVDYLVDSGVFSYDDAIRRVRGE